jgi:hypothetical protein
MIRVRYVMGILTILLAFSCPTPVRADVLELKNGQKLEGRYAGGSKEEIRFQVGSQTLRFPTGEVSKITIGTSGKEDFRKTAREALRQLKALASVAEGETTYRDYAPRVSDAKIKIDQFLDEHKPSPVPKFNEYIADSLGFYVAASAAWNTRLLGPEEKRNASLRLLENDYIRKCTPLQKAMPPSDEMVIPDPLSSAAQKRTVKVPGLRLAWAIEAGYGIPLLWECARNSLIDAEKALNR